MEPLKRIPLNDVHRHSKARMTELATIGNDIEIMIRDKPVIAHIVSKKFYKRGVRNESQGI